MPTVTQINSKIALVKFSLEDLAELNLARYIRTSLKGVGRRALIAEDAFESIASRAYIEQYPGCQIKIAEKCILNDDNSVDVILRIASGEDKEYYEKHPNQVVLSKQEKGAAE